MTAIAAPPTTVLVVDDQNLVAMSIEFALRGMGFDAHQVPVTGSVLDAAAGFQPGVVLLDLDLGLGGDGVVRDGTELIVPLRAQGWRVLVVTGSTELGPIAAAVAHGASGWVVKGADLTELVDTTLAVSEGQVLLTEERRAALVARYREDRTSRDRAVAGLRRLSRRERVVLDQLACGSTPTEIAQHAHLSLATVRNQIHAVLGKLEVNSQLGAVAIAHRFGRPGTRNG